VDKKNASESDACSYFESQHDKWNEKRRHIIDAEPTTNISTTKIHKDDPKDEEEWESLCHSYMWMKGSPLQFIVNSGSQNKLISAEIVKRLGLPTIAHLKPYTIRWLHLG